MISHDLSLANFCEKVLCYSDMNQFQYGTFQELSQQEGKFKELNNAYMSLI